MSEIGQSYELEMLKIVINKYLDESISFTKNSLNELETKRDQSIWDLATKVYQQSGHKVELSLVQDIVNSRIRTIKNQLIEEERYIDEQKAQEAAAREARHIDESDPKFLAQVTDVPEKFVENECKAKIFVKVRKILSKHLSVEESEVSLDGRLSNHLNEYDLLELQLALEEEFDIEISEEDFWSYSDMKPILGSSSWWNLSSSSSSSFRYNIGEKCIENFVELIYKEISG